MSPRLVLAADTVVECEGRVLGKPAGPAEAAAHLRLLSGRWHRVVTGLVLVSPAGDLREATEVSRVRLGA